MFRGATKVTLDDKGRMVMPTRYREEITDLCQGHLVVTVDRDQCLAIYPLSEWERTERELINLPSLNAEARALQRLMVGYATDLELDGHGRLLLPPELREFGKLERYGMLIGQGHKFELWDEALWGVRRDQWLSSPQVGGEKPPALEKLKL